MDITLTELSRAGGLGDAIDGAGIGATLGAAANVADRAHQVNKVVKTIKR